MYSKIRDQDQIFYSNLDTIFMVLAGVCKINKVIVEKSNMCARLTTSALRVSSRINWRVPGFVVILHFCDNGFDKISYPITWYEINLQLIFWHFIWITKKQPRKWRIAFPCHLYIKICIYTLHFILYWLTRHRKNTWIF